MTHLKRATHCFKGLRDTTHRVLSIARCHFFQLVVLSVLLLPLPVLSAVCPPEGSGGDPILNQLKNRDTAPPAYKEMTVDQFLKALIPDLKTPRHRNKFSASVQGYVQNNEAQGMALVGYILGAKLSGPESSNCNDLRRRDFHIWIGAKKPGSPQEAQVMRKASVVVEVTPNGQDSHPGWKLRILQRLAQNGAKVRISGWVMYDLEHPDQVGKTRGTLWEVHPITKIEVWSNGKWREL